MQLFFATSFVSEGAVYALSWTLLHSLWQGALLALVVGVMMHLCRKSKASLRYHLLSLTLILFVIGVLTTGALAWQKQHLRNSKSMSIDLPQKEAVQVHKTAPISPPIPLLIHYQKVFYDFFDRHTFAIITIWMLVLAFKIVRLSIDLWYIRRIRYHRIHLPNRNWLSRMQTLANRLNINFPVQLLESELVINPSVIGFFKPLVLVPVGLFNSLPPEQVEAILLHELSHIRRSDYLINFIQCLLELIFFFNPGLLWVSALIRIEREHCCDDLAVAAMDNKFQYINALVSFQEFNLKGAKYALAFANQKMPLLDRIKRLINHHNYKTLTIMEKVSLLAGVLLISAVTFFSLQKSQAQSGNYTSNFSSVNINGAGSPSSPRTIVARDKKGKLYKINRVDNKTVGLQVAGKDIAQEHFKDYDWVIKKIDEEIKVETAQMQKQLKRDAETAQHDKETEERDAETAQRDAETAERDAETAQRDAKTAQRDRKTAEADQKVIEDIIDELVNDKIIKSKSDLRDLKLEDNIFKVNGEKQSPALLQKYQDKFLKVPNGKRTFNLHSSKN